MTELSSGEVGQISSLTNTEKTPLGFSEYVAIPVEPGTILLNPGHTWQLENRLKKLNVDGWESLVTETLFYTLPTAFYEGSEPTLKYQFKSSFILNVSDLMNNHLFLDNAAVRIEVCNIIAEECAQLRVQNHIDGLQEGVTSTVTTAQLIRRETNLKESVVHLVDGLSEIGKLDWDLRPLFRIVPTLTDSIEKLKTFNNDS